MLGLLRMVKLVGVVNQKRWSLNKFKLNSLHLLLHLRLFFLFFQQSKDIWEQHDDAPIPLAKSTVNEPVIIQKENCMPQEPFRRYVREIIYVITNDYVIYAVESESDLSLDEDLYAFRKAMESDNSWEWSIATKEETKSMCDNQVWELVELPKGFQSVDSKWVFKTKNDLEGNSERYKAHLIAKCFI